MRERERRGERENKRRKEREREKKEKEGEGERVLSLFYSHFLLFRSRYASLQYVVRLNLTTHNTHTLN